jgi:hypothetical protein
MNLLQWIPSAIVFVGFLGLIVWVSFYARSGDGEE